MDTHLVIGSGPVGTAVASELLAGGHHVRILTRRGTGPTEAELLCGDASDANVVTAAAKGAAAIHNCANPAYNRWAKDWPPLADAILAAARTNGSVVAITGNLYPYGPVDGPMSVTTPERPSSTKGLIRQRMWDQARHLAAEGHIPGAVEVRGSDYVGACPSVLTMMVLPRFAAHKGAALPADLDAPHTWTDPADAGRLLATVATTPSAWGQVWHVPSPEPISVRELAQRAAVAADVPFTTLRTLPQIVLRSAGIFDTMARSFAEMTYQFRAPFVLDASATVAAFGPRHSSLDSMIAANAEYFRGELAR